MDLPDLIDSNARVRVRNNGTDVAARRTLNFLGTGLTITDDPANEEVEVTLTTSEWTTVRKTADETDTNSSGMQDDNELLFTAANGTWYEFEAFLIFTADSAADITFGFGEDGTASRGYVYGTMLTATSSGTVLRAEPTDQGAGSSMDAGVNPAGGSVKMLALARGFHVGAGGTFRLRWAQNVSNANATTLYAKSYLRYKILTT